MRNIVVGSFMGFVLAAAFLAACGGGGVLAPSTSKPAVTGEFRWTAPGDPYVVSTNVTVSGDVWQSVSVYDNSTTDARNQYAMFELVGNVDGGSSATFEVGLLPAPNGANYASSPQWVGTIQMAGGTAQRATLFPAPLLPTRFKVALRLVGGATARLSSFTMTPYNAIQL